MRLLGPILSNCVEWNTLFWFLALIPFLPLSFNSRKAFKSCKFSWSFSLPKYQPKSELMYILHSRMYSEVTRLWKRCRVWTVIVNQNFNPPRHFFKANTDLKLEVEFNTPNLFKRIVKKLTELFPWGEWIQKLLI